jgi:hypothetical protein
MRKYLLAVLAIIAGTIISAKTAELALDANGNTAKILIPKDAFTIQFRRLNSPIEIKRLIPGLSNRKIQISFSPLAVAGSEQARPFLRRPSARM